MTSLNYSQIAGQVGAGETMGIQRDSAEIGINICGNLWLYY